MSIADKIAKKLLEELRNRPEYGRIFEIQVILEHVLQALERELSAVMHRRDAITRARYYSVAYNTVNELIKGGYKDYLAELVISKLNTLIEEHFAVSRSPEPTIVFLKNMMEKPFQGFYDFGFCKGWKDVVQSLEEDYADSGLEQIREFAFETILTRMEKNTAFDRGMFEAAEVVLKYCDNPHLLILSQSLQEIQKSVQRQQLES